VAAGATADRISFGNTIRKERDIAGANGSVGRRKRPPDAEPRRPYCPDLPMTPALTVPQLDYHPKLGTTNMNAMTETTTAMAPARRLQKADRDDRLRLDRPRNAAADRAPHRLRPKQHRRSAKGGAMAVDLPKFITTAMELYELWPSLFNWAASLIIPIVIALVTASWWIGGYRAEASEVALKGQIAVLEQRLALTTEQRDAAQREVEKIRKESDLRGNSGYPTSEPTLTPGRPKPSVWRFPDERKRRP
jgi:hypothetical protein